MPAATLRPGEILATPLPTDREMLARGARIIGASRDDRPIVAVETGVGPLTLSLIGGCHADEPVGPETLARLAAFLLELDPAHPLLTQFSWYLVPHVNPDGRSRNRSWSERRLSGVDSRERPDRIFDLASYLEHAEREPPGEDVEFGFPESDGDSARPETVAVAGFLEGAGPFHLHASFHGMGFAPGPWFLIEPSWIDRTTRMRDAMRSSVAAMGLRPYDVDRRGEKGFCRIDEGFSTRPDSAAMKAFFLERDDPETASRFRPSSMEYVRRLGGDPLTIVTEMPLFLFAERTRPVAEVRNALAAAAHDESRLARRAAELGVRAFPIRDQARLQLSFLNEALAAIAGQLRAGQST